MPATGATDELFLLLTPYPIFFTTYYVQRTTPYLVLPMHATYYFCYMLHTTHYVIHTTSHVLISPYHQLLIIHHLLPTTILLAYWLLLWS